MKLRNKKTGEIIDIYKGEIRLHYNQGRKTIHFKCLEDLEEWEDYEEPKERWYINENGGVLKYVPSDPEGEDLAYMKYQNEIGNYFDTREEAEKAVEKLKAAKRLKDNGFRFIPEASYVEQMKETGESMMFIACTMNDYRDFVFGDNTDIKLLFGGEE